LFALFQKETMGTGFNAVCAQADTENGSAASRRLNDSPPCEAFSLLTLQLACSMILAGPLTFETLGGVGRLAAAEHPAAGIQLHGPMSARASQSRQPSLWNWRAALLAMHTLVYWFVTKQTSEN
jgi:hypothetical protein